VTSQVEPAKPGVADATKAAPDRSAEEAARRAEEIRKAEEARRAEEARKAEEARRKAEEERRKAEEAAKKQKEEEKILVAKKEPPGIGEKAYESPLLKDVYFDFDKYSIRPSDAEILKENAAVLMKNSTWKIQVEGHCDERGTVEYNLALGERRANSVKKYLLSLGVPENRLSTISYGKEKPLDPAHNEAAWAKNRRAQFTIVAK